jgi:sterol desaturase/sphingolipid hydroxylase (fatty acid hydroxylase superfamily)
MDRLHNIVDGFATPFLNLLSPTFGLSVFYLLSSLVVVAAVYVVTRRRVRGNLVRFLRYALPGKLLLHHSAMLDYRYYLVNGVMRALIYGSLIVGSQVWSSLTIAGLTSMFGAGQVDGTATFVIVALTTVVFVVAFDLGYWLAHWLLHWSTLLWEFHKVHHSAEVLNPFTAFRSHPVEDLLSFNMISVTTGVSHGVLVYAFGAGAQELTLLQVNVVMLVYYLTIFHLRHSHVWLPVRGFLAYVIQSPAHHQIHHSVEAQHVGKNLGFCLSLWDWIFGTLFIPEHERGLRFGIGKEGREFSSIGRLYALPFVRAGRQLGRKFGLLSPHTPPKEPVPPTAPVRAD